MGWKRWPCPFCQHSQRLFNLICPQCESLPWGPSESRRGDQKKPALPYEAGRGSLLLAPNQELSIRSSGLFRLEQRFSTPSGYLGVLSRRFFGRAQWLGTDGHEWRIGGAGQFRRVALLFDGEQPIAAAQAEAFRGGYRLWQGTERYRLERAGLFRHRYTLKNADDEEAFRIESGFLSPVRTVEISRPVALATVVLMVYFLTRMKQTET